MRGSVSTTVIQTGIRMELGLYERLKRNAKMERRSLNNYVVGILEEATRPSFPKIKLKDFKIDDDLLSLGKVIGDVPAELIEGDDRLKYILSK